MISPRKIAVGLMLVVILNIYLFSPIPKIETDSKNGPEGNGPKTELKAYYQAPDFLAYFRLPEAEADSAKKPLRLRQGAQVVHEIQPYAHIPQTQHHVSLADIQGHGKFSGAFSAFMTHIVLVIEKHKPEIPGINNAQHYAQAQEETIVPNEHGRMPKNSGHLREGYLEDPIRSKEYLQYFLRPTEKEVKALKEAHQAYLEEMPTDFPPNLYKYGKLSAFMEGDGIVYLGGGEYSQLALISISMLRATGSVLPVEVILPRRSDFDIDFCSQALPSLNAKCKIAEDFLPKNVSDNLAVHQLKTVALLVSSFQNVLYLDADNLPVRNPDYLFVNEPFLSKRMVVWPDLWRRAISPHYYEAAGIETDENFKMRSSYTDSDPRGKSASPLETSFHDTKGTIAEGSSDPSQLLIDKKKHFSSLLLTLYYNYHGPDYYYALFSQGSANGDKEAFVAAAHKLDLPYYLVNEFSREFGPLAENKHQNYAQGQYDPIVDYLELITPDRTEQFGGNFAKSDKDPHSNYNRHLYKAHTLMFLHAKSPKFFLDEISNFNGKNRLYTSLLEESDVDVEKVLMTHILGWFCDANINMSNLPEYESAERASLCSQVHAHLAFLETTA